MKAHFIKYSKESLGYYFYLSDDYNMIVSRHAKFLKRDFIRDGDSGRKIQLKENIFEEQRAIEPVEPIPPHRSSRIIRFPKRCIGMLTEDIEKIFLMDDVDHINDPKIYDEGMSDIDS